MRPSQSRPSDQLSRGRRYLSRTAKLIYQVRMREINMISSEVWETLWTNGDAWADTSCYLRYAYHAGWLQDMQLSDWEYHGHRELIHDNRVWSVGPMLQTLWAVWWTSWFWSDLNWHRQGCFTIRDLTFCNASILFGGSWTDTLDSVGSSSKT
jgi:hypothetical protein